MFSCRQDQRNRLTHRDLIAGLSGYASQGSGSRRLDLHRGFVGFNFHERLTLGHGLTFAFKPLEQGSRLLRDAERRHNHVGCHITIVARVRDSCSSKLAFSGSDAFW
jgi:hypothetical protein